MTDLAPCQTLSYGEIPGTRRDCSLHDRTVPLDPVCRSRERDGIMDARLAKMTARTVDEWRTILEGRIEFLERLVKKTTNSQRALALTNGDPRGIRGYLCHAQIGDFPNDLIGLTMVTNESINRLLRAIM